MFYWIIIWFCLRMQFSIKYQMNKLNFKTKLQLSIIGILHFWVTHKLKYVCHNFFNDVYACMCVMCLCRKVKCIRKSVFHFSVSTSEKNFLTYLQWDLSMYIRVTTLYIYKICTRLLCVWLCVLCTLYIYIYIYFNVICGRRHLFTREENHIPYSTL